MNELEQQQADQELELYKRITMTPLDLQKLAYPFRRPEHEFLQGMVYIRELAITNRLDQVDPYWSFKVNEVIVDGDARIAIATLTVKGITRTNSGGGPVQVESKAGAMDRYRVADNTVNANKSAVTDALKRCARLHGIGRYLLGAPKEGTAFDKWLNDLRTAAAARFKDASAVTAVDVAEDE